MREIKFRGKDSFSNEWRYGNLLIIDENYHIVEKADISEDGHHFRQEGDRPTWVDETTIGQFTGLKDELGRDLYEGDIIESSYGNRHFIKYDYSNGAFVAVPYSDDDFSAPRYLVNSWIFKFRKRIIGNIYDNKDLMKEETK